MVYRSRTKIYLDLASRHTLILTKSCSIVSKLLLQKIQTGLSLVVKMKPLL